MNEDTPTGGTVELSDTAMRMARLSPAVEVECKDCGLIGYERNRGDAWIAFAGHWRESHTGRADG